MHVRGEIKLVVWGMLAIIRGFSERGRNAGEVDEWLKSHAWKACIGSNLSGVRIPLSPPKTQSKKPPSGGFFVLCVAERSKPPAGLAWGIRRHRPYRGEPLRIVHLPPLRGGAPEAQRAAQIL